jgi:hypothetical protein
MLKTIEQKLRDKERQEIIRADQESARSLQRFVKKARVNDTEELKERPSMTQYAQYSLENKYLAFEKALKQAYNMVDNNLEFDGFVNVITSYNELVNYIVSIAKYNTLSQSLRVPIDERMNRLNDDLINLIDRSKSLKKYRLTSLEQMYDNIRNKIYKLVNIDINFKKYTADDTKKEELKERIDKNLNVLSATANKYKTVERTKTQPLDLKNYGIEVRGLKKKAMGLNLTTKAGEAEFKKIDTKIKDIEKRVVKNYRNYLPPDVLLGPLQLKNDEYNDPYLEPVSNPRNLLLDLENQPSARQALQSMRDPRDPRELYREMRFMPSPSEIMQSLSQGPIRIPKMPDVSPPKRRGRPPKLLKYEAPREDKDMIDPENVDVPASQVLAPILQPEAVQEMENAQDIFQQAFDKFKDPNYGMEESAEEKLNKGPLNNEPEDALLGEEPVQKKKRGRPPKILKEFKFKQEPEEKEEKQEKEYKEIEPEEKEYKEIEPEDDDDDEPDLEIDEEETMNAFFAQNPLKGVLRNKFINLLAKREKARSGGKIEDIQKKIRAKDREDGFYLNDTFSRLYLNNDSELKTIIEKEKTGYVTKLYDEFSEDEHKLAKKTFDTYKSLITDDNIIEILADEFITKNKNAFKGYDYEERLQQATKMIKKDIQKNKINLIDQLFRLKQEKNKGLLRIIKNIESYEREK